MKKVLLAKVLVIAQLVMGTFTEVLMLRLLVVEILRLKMRYFYLICTLIPLMQKIQ